VLIDGGKRRMVSKTVVLELEWVLRCCYGLTPRQTQQVLAIYSIWRMWRYKIKWLCNRPPMR
jgi:hypothetical protein